MKLTRILSIPFALAADVVTLGNMGDRSFTQQVFDSERRDRESRDALEALRLLAEINKANRP
jgi:hypothetical protein